MSSDRFRTLLSLLGVAVGIFSIVAALTLVDSMQKTLQDSFSAYGSDLLFVDREPLEPDLDEDGVFRWWAYADRPQVSWRDYQFLRTTGADAWKEIAFVAYGLHSVGVAGDWQLLTQQPLSIGRGFTSQELESGAPVLIVGAEAEAQCGDKLWLDGVRYEVIGIFAKAGMTTVAPIDIDQVRLMPYRAMEGPVFKGSILLSEAEPARIRALMRTARRLTPLEADNFAVNKFSFLLEEMKEIFELASKLGWLIGFFALLAGGFGIANMLYVSVEERRSQIGICRALGATRRIIQRDFLKEAMALSQSGAGIGIGLVAICAKIVKFFVKTDMQLTLSLQSIILGVGISVIVGLVFGAAPARTAARLSPVEAISGQKK